MVHVTEFLKILTNLGTGHNESVTGSGTKQPGSNPSSTTYYLLDFEQVT